MIIVLIIFCYLTIGIAISVYLNRNYENDSSLEDGIFITLWLPILLLYGIPYIILTSLGKISNGISSTLDKFTNDK